MPIRTVLIISKNIGKKLFVILFRLKIIKLSVWKQWIFLHLLAHLRAYIHLRRNSVMMLPEFFQVPQIWIRICTTIVIIRMETISIKYLPQVSNIIMWSMRMNKFWDFFLFFIHSYAFTFCFHILYGIWQWRVYRFLTVVSESLMCNESLLIFNMGLDVDGECLIW